MNLNITLKLEIDHINSKYELTKLLGQYGKVFITGSYIYDVMAWRDFDLVLELPNLDIKQVYEIIKEIGQRINPSELKIMNNIDKMKSNKPIGVWVGIYIDSWKIDLWIMDHENSIKEQKSTNELASMLENVDKNALILLKSELSKNPDYHIKFSSVDLYNAFTSANVRTVGQFYDWLKRKRLLNNESTMKNF